MSQQAAKVLFIAISLFCQVSASGEGGVHVVGNGGGFAETQATFIHQQLELMIKGCISSANPCHLEPSDLGDLRKVSELSDSEVDVALTFVPTLGGDASFATDRKLGAPIVVASDSLYDKDEKAKPPAAIAAIILAARLSHVNDKAPLSQLIGFSEELTRQITFSHRSARIVPSDKILALHDFGFAFEEMKQHALFIEDALHTRDVSGSVEAELPFGQLQEWTFLNWRGAHYPGDLIFTARAKHQNGDTYVIQIQTSVDASGLLTSSKPRVSMKADW